MTAEATAQAPAALTEPLPAPAQPSAAEMDADPAVQSAVRFLQDARVQRSPIESQIRFLKSKGVADAQIVYAFSKVGRSVTAEKVASVRAPPANAVPTTAAATPLAAQLKTPRVPVVATAAAPGPQYTQTLFPHSPPPPQEEPQAKLVDWRDVVIGAGAAVLAGFAGYKLFHRYSPYEFRRKSEKKPRLYKGSYARHRPTNNASDGSETDASSTPQRGRVPPLPPPPQAAAAAEPIVTTAAAGEPGDEVKRLQTELDETKEALASERKKCADLAVSAAKIRADKQQLSRANDRYMQQIESLKKEIEKAEEAKKSASDEAAPASTEEAAPAPAPASTYFPSVTAEAEQARKSPVSNPVAVPASAAATTMVATDSPAAVPPVLPPPTVSAAVPMVPAAAALPEPVPVAAAAEPTAAAAPSPLTASELFPSASLPAAAATPAVEAPAPSEAAPAPATPAASMS